MIRPAIFSDGTTINIEEIRKVLKKLNSRKATGLYNIPNNLLKYDGQKIKAK